MSSQQEEETGLATLSSQQEEETGLATLSSQPIEEETGLATLASRPAYNASSLRRFSLRLQVYPSSVYSSKLSKSISVKCILFQAISEAFNRSLSASVSGFFLLSLVLFLEETRYHWNIQRAALSHYKRLLKPSV